MSFLINPTNLPQSNGSGPSKLSPHPSHPRPCTSPHQQHHYLPINPLTNALFFVPLAYTPDQGLSSWDALIDGLLAVPPNTASLQGYSNQLTHSCAAAAATPALDHPYHAAAAARAAEALLEREVMRNAAQAAAAAAAASAAAPTVREAASTAKYEIWFPQTAEEVEAWNAVMGLVAGMAKQRAVETVRAKEEKAERIAAEMVNAGEGEEELTARLRQQQHQQPPLFDGYGVAVEHLEVVVSLGLLNRSRTFCDVSIRNAARIQKVSRETSLPLVDELCHASVTTLETCCLVFVFVWTRRQC